jgi:hypothetical protein
MAIMKASFLLLAVLALHLHSAHACAHTYTHDGGLMPPQGRRLMEVGRSWAVDGSWLPRGGLADLRHAALLASEAAAAELLPWRKHCAFVLAMRALSLR